MSVGISMKRSSNFLWPSCCSQRSFNIYWVFLFVTCNVLTVWGRHHQNFSSLQTLEENRSAKWFPLFSIVRVANDPCNPEMAGVAGTCFTKSQCRNNGGVESGTCASGFGVCCVVAVSCDSVITHNNTNFRNRDAPESFSPTSLEVCNTRIIKPANVCQIRLDFVSLRIADSDNTNGRCLTDHFSVNGISGTVPANLCGDLTGQHMYLDYGTSDRITLSFLTDGGANTLARNWNIRVTYIECNSISRAPDGCLQYFTTASGQVRMLGYGSSLPHLADLDYTVCVRSEDGAGSIVWTPCQGEDLSKSFFLTGAMPLAADGMTDAMIGLDCITDYILIMSETEAMETAEHDRYCGNVFSVVDPPVMPHMVTSIAKPFIMRVKTDDMEPATDVENTGFCLAFRQQPPRPG